MERATPLRRGGDRVDGGARFARSFRRGPARAGRGGAGASDVAATAARVVRGRAATANLFARRSRGRGARVRDGASGRCFVGRERARVVSRRRRSLERAPNRTAATTRRREPRSSPPRLPESPRLNDLRLGGNQIGDSSRRDGAWTRRTTLFPEPLEPRTRLRLSGNRIADAGGIAHGDGASGKGYGRKGAALTDQWARRRRGGGSSARGSRG